MKPLNLKFTTFYIFLFINWSGISSLLITHNLCRTDVLRWRGGGGVTQISMLWQTISYIRVSIQGLLCRKIYQSVSSYLNKRNIFIVKVCFQNFQNPCLPFFKTWKDIMQNIYIDLSFSFLIRNCCFLNIWIFMISLKFLIYSRFKKISQSPKF